MYHYLTLLPQFGPVDKYVDQLMGQHSLQSKKIRNEYASIKDQLTMHSFAIST